jgi:hypothetical protein
MLPGFVRFESDLIAVNCTPHSIRFLDGETIREVQPSGYTLRAMPKETQVDLGDGSVEFVRTVFEPSDEGTKELDEIERRDLLPIGSIISAQAWPGRVVSLIPVEGYERKPPAEKLYRPDKFNTFG